MGRLSPMRAAGSGLLHVNEGWRCAGYGGFQALREPA